jgi:hypothetical protein
MVHLDRLLRKYTLVDTGFVTVTYLCQGSFRCPSNSARPVVAQRFGVLLDAGERRERSLALSLGSSRTPAA